MRQREEAYRVLEAALSIASAGVDEAEVGLLGGQLATTSFANNQFDVPREHGHEQLAVRLVRRGRWMQCSTSDMSADGIAQAAQQARAELSRWTSTAPGLGFNLPPAQNYQTIDAFDASTAEATVLERAARAARAITASLRASEPTHQNIFSGKRASVSASGALVIGRGGINRQGYLRPYALANTRGLLAYHPSTMASFEVMMESGSRLGRVWRQSYALGAIDVRAAVAGVLHKLGPTTELAYIPPGRYMVVLEPTAVAELVRVVGRNVGLDQVVKGCSFLSSGSGAQLIDKRLSIMDDCSHPAHRGSPFDADGVARKQVVIVNEGVGQAPLVGWPSSLKYEREPTGHGVVSPCLGEQEAAEYLVMTGKGARTTEQLVEGTRAGVLVSGFENIELVDARTLRIVGSTAHGSYAIERGELTEPLVEQRIDISILDILSQVDELGKEVWAEGAVVPPLRIDGFPFYGFS